LNYSEFPDSCFLFKFSIEKDFLKWINYTLIKENGNIFYRDNTDRIEVERSFSLSKRCYGLGLIRTKLYETTLSAVALSVFVTNLFRMQARILLLLCWFYQVFKVQSEKFNIQPV
jgi:hypothetical protein